MTYEFLMDEIESIEGVRFESLVQMPVKRDPDWPKWVARATREGISFSGTGRSDVEAMQKLLNDLTGEAGA